MKFCGRRERLDSILNTTTTKAKTKTKWEFIAKNQSGEGSWWKLLTGFHAT